MSKYSFRDFLEEEILIDPEKDIKIKLNRITIPMIQRDYAQGRVSEKEVRNRFLNNIFESLLSESKMEMDFVYGSVLEEDKQSMKEYIFTPLDGQQRLTTLMLLYWYIGSRELKGTQKSDLMKSLAKFNYATRASTSAFCSKLVDTELSFTENPQIEITDLYWFFNSYYSDPTICSMLTMLDCIHEKYNASENLGKKLFNNLQNLQFFVLPLNKFNLSEELYIKMNARGKQLTSFENFKADFTNWMTIDENPHRTNLSATVEYKMRNQPKHMAISQKIDNEWTNFLWSFMKDIDITEKNEKGHLNHPDGKIVDTIFLRLFYRFSLNKFIFQSKKETKQIDKENEYKFFNSEEKYTDFKIARFHSKVDIDEKEFAITDANIIIATYQSFGTGMDVENIKYVISFYKR
jgi:hypothetical protein